VKKLESLELSALRHTWILDLDGTILKHNGYKLDGHDTFLPNAESFLCDIPNDDMIIFLTSRTEEYSEITEGFLKNNNIRFDHIIYNAPYGERIIINDCKPSGLKMAEAINLERDSGDFPKIVINNNI